MWYKSPDEDPGMTQAFKSSVFKINGKIPKKIILKEN